MKPLSEILTELGIAFTFPIEITDSSGVFCRTTYYEDSNGYWEKWERDAEGNPTYFEDSNKSWKKWERDDKGNPTYMENSYGLWHRWERDANGIETYYESSDGTKEGTPKSAKTCEGKVSEEEGRAFCDERFHQLLERNKMVRLKNR